MQNVTIIKRRPMKKNRFLLDLLLAFVLIFTSFSFNLYPVNASQEEPAAARRRFIRRSGRCVCRTGTAGFGRRSADASAGTGTAASADVLADASEEAKQRLRLKQKTTACGCLPRRRCEPCLRLLYSPSGVDKERSSISAALPLQISKCADLFQKTIPMPSSFMWKISETVFIR